MNVNHKILLKSIRGFVFQPLDEILFFKSTDKYSEMYLANGSMVIVFNGLGELEVRLNCGERKGAILFYRTHRQYIAAIHHASNWPEMQRLQFDGLGSIPVSRSRAQELKRILLMPI